MLLLMLFALIAGGGTAITPCVLPVLPALLSASAVGGRRRPLGIVLGLAVTFTIAIVALAQLVKGVGIAGGAARTLAIIVLIAFGFVLLIPGLAERVQAPLSRLARFGPRSRGDGFWSGVGVGGALGFVCAPCAGPILAAVTSVSASGGASARVVAVALAYAAGLSAVLLLYCVGGRAVVERIRRSTRGQHARDRDGALRRARRAQPESLALARVGCGRHKLAVRAAHRRRFLLQDVHVARGAVGKALRTRHSARGGSWTRKS